ncbi:MAG: dihydrodipicolinate synthase family protein [Planctomycetota bacterium]|nr:dihydrodipicolinate synthase family protein [Planctomycetota bacterium]
MKIVKTNGLIAAPFTPMHSNCTVNLDAIEQYANRLLSDGVVGAFICGTTGEAMSLTLEERIQVAERWMLKAPKNLRVIVHVGHNAIADCKRLAAHAQLIGANSIACMAPFFFKPNSVESLVQWCEQVAAAAPNLPFYYYHIPSMTGVTIPVHDFLTVAADRIPNLVGVKFTYEDLEDFGRCLKFDNQRFDVLFGRDERLLAAFDAGARGAVGSTYNFAAPLYRSLIDSFLTGDQQSATKHQTLAVEMINTLVAGGSSPIATFKWFMKRVGIDCGPARIPLQNLTTEQIDMLESKLKAIGIYEAIEFRESNNSGK